MRFSKGRSFLFRIPEGEEIVAYLTDFALKHNVLIGTVEAIGTLRNPKIGYFQRDLNEYKVISLEGYYELASLMGNVSLKDGKPFLHLHVVLGDENGHAYAGHLVEGEVFIAEVFLQELLGELLERKPLENGLSLWDAEE
jgi:predicted DNA-binding protein with PD1-like motif